MSDSQDKILAAIAPVFREVFERPDLVLTPELSANDVEEWDSLNHISLVVELESLAGIQFSTDELANMANVGDLVGILIARGYKG